MDMAGIYTVHAGSTRRCAKQSDRVLEPQRSAYVRTIGLEAAIENANFGRFQTAPVRQI
jgi:hypothetical protein